MTKAQTKSISTKEVDLGCYATHKKIKPEEWLKSREVAHEVYEANKKLIQSEISYMKKD